MPSTDPNDPVVIESGYQSLTDQTGTLDTSGTGGKAHHDVSLMSPVFEVAKEHELATALRSLDPEDTEVDPNLVLVNEKVAPGHEQAVVADRIAESLDEVQAAPRYGTDEWFEANTGDDQPTVNANPEGSGEDSPVNTNLTGTLDTSGTAGAGVPSADDISASAQAEAAVESDEAPKPVKKATKAKKAAKKAPAKSKS